MFGDTYTPVIGQSRHLVAIVAVGLVLLFIVGIDQGHLLSLVQGSVAFDQNLIHELTHDARHVVGFPCH